MPCLGQAQGFTPWDLKTLSSKRKTCSQVHACWPSPMIQYFYLTVLISVAACMQQFSVMRTTQNKLRWVTCMLAYKKNSHTQIVLGYLPHLLSSTPAFPRNKALKEALLAEPRDWQCDLLSRSTLALCWYWHAFTSGYSSYAVSWLFWWGLQTYSWISRFFLSAISSAENSHCARSVTVSSLQETNRKSRQNGCRDKKGILSPFFFAINKWTEWQYLQIQIAVIFHVREIIAAITNISHIICLCAIPKRKWALKSPDHFFKQARLRNCKTFYTT